MKAVFFLAITVALAVNAPAITTNLISNGSFESGTIGWLLTSGQSKSFLTNWAYQGANALMVTNRNSFTNAPRQDVTAAVSIAPINMTWTTRFAVSVATPTTVRAWLLVIADKGTGPLTFKYLLAERVVRATNQWTQIHGTRLVDWPGTLVSALFYTEVGMKQEPRAGGLA